MTCIADIPTKKELKDRIERGETVFIKDPSVFEPFSGPLDVYVTEYGVCYLTNHPKRSWFAKVTFRGQTLRVE